MHSGTKDVISGSFLLVVAAGAWWEGSGISSAFSIGVGSGFMPRVAGVALGLVSAIIIVTGLLQRAKTSDPMETSLWPDRVWPVGLTLLLIGLYVSVLGTLGFITSTILYLVAQFFVLAPAEDRRPLLFVIIAAAVAVAVYFIFTRGFDLILPAGLLI